MASRTCRRLTWTLSLRAGSLSRAHTPRRRSARPPAPPSLLVGRPKHRSCLTPSVLIAGPGIRHNSSSPFPGSHVDIAPTILAMANITPPAWVDGSSLVPLIVTASDAAVEPMGASARTFQLTTHYNQGPYTRRHAGVTRSYDDASNTFLGVVYTPGASSAETATLKLGMYDPLGKQSGFAHPTGYELFNLTQDPYETTNIYARISASRPDLVGALVRKLRELYTCAGGEECAAAAAGEPTTINTPTSAPQTPADALVCDAMGSAALGDDYCQMCLGCSVFCPRCTTAQ